VEFFAATEAPVKEYVEGDPAGGYSASGFYSRFSSQTTILQDSGSANKDNDSIQRQDPPHSIAPKLYVTACYTKVEFVDKSVRLTRTSTMEQE